MWRGGSNSEAGMGWIKMKYAMNFSNIETYKNLFKITFAKPIKLTLTVKRKV